MEGKEYLMAGFRVEILRFPEGFQDRRNYFPIPYEIHHFRSTNTG
jgi:hypothetical protein